MKFRWILILLSILFLSSCATSNNSENNDEWKHNEEFHYHINDKTFELFDLSEHQFNKDVIREATEEIEGEIVYTCSICGYTKRETIEKLEHTHTFSESWSNDENNHWHDSICEHDVISDKGEHSFDDGKIIKEATEEKEGEIVFTCFVCGYTKIETIEKLEHTHKFSEAWTTDDEYHWHSSTCAHNVVDGMSEHLFDDGQIIKEATVNEEGEQEFTCIICGFKKTDIISKLNSPIYSLKTKRVNYVPESYDGIEAFSEHWIFDKDLSKYNFSEHPELLYTLTFGDTTMFPSGDKLPEGYDPEELLEWGKYPGLNIDILHKYGFTGKGVTIAYVDQPWNGHEQYENANIKSYKEYQQGNSSVGGTSMHGPGVTSLLCGKDIGTAPDVNLYYYCFKGAVDFSLSSQTMHAKCLYQIIEDNKKLPDDQKIRFVAFSDNPDPREQDIEAFYEAAEACEKAGIMVFFCADYGGVSFIPLSDKNDFNNLTLESWYEYYFSPKTVFVPTSGRTTAAEIDGNQYIYWGTFGLSWSMPYVAGLYAIALSVDPTLSKEELQSYLVETAYINDLDMKIINPVGYICKILRKVGKDDIADKMEEEVLSRQEYIYALVDSASLDKEDLTSIGNYLSNLNKEVIVVDTSSFKNAKEIYIALKDDYESRKGICKGIQIFGNRNIVPSFYIDYIVDMGENGLDDGGSLYTDLFYSNFDNEADYITDHWDVNNDIKDGKLDTNLTPSWPVVRLPLDKGEFKAFFDKYQNFIKTTSLERLDIVNFSNPIFSQKIHSDNFGGFLINCDKEYNIIDVNYKLYGNLKGDYPVTHEVEGGFTKESLTKVNKLGIQEIIINSHGQWNNIDNAFFINGEEKRESLINIDNINDVLNHNYYYLDTWTCSNGSDMENNLTTAALNGKCVGMFSATTIISNNGAIYNASLNDMKKGNFYYFYYCYLKSLNEGNNRSEAFFDAQVGHSIALKEDIEKNGIRYAEGNQGFNLYNLLTYHNFGVIEPSYYSYIRSNSTGYLDESDFKVEKENNSQGNLSHEKIELTDGKPVGEEIIMRFFEEYKGVDEIIKVGKISAIKLSNGYYRLTITYVCTEFFPFSCYNPPSGSAFMYRSSISGSSEERRLSFDIKAEDLKSVQQINFDFYKDENNYYLAYILSRDIVKEIITK